jgi:AP-1 complex subunit mu
MVASSIFITDLTGKPLISRNYRGDIPLTSAIDRFASYLNEVEDDVKKPVFHVDAGGEVLNIEDVGCTGSGGETFVYIQVSHYMSRKRRICICGENGKCHLVGWLPQT